jgi:ABC-2 type transport system ATP-binding protein
VNLLADAHRRAKTLSGGMRQRLGLAIALLGTPDLLIVDEPTVALDQTERHRVHELLIELAETRTVIFSTHLVSDVEALSRRVLVLHEGRLVRDGPPDVLAERLTGMLFRAEIARADVYAVRNAHDVIRESLVAGTVHVVARGMTAPDARFVAIQPTLADVFADATTPSR